MSDAGRALYDDEPTTAASVDTTPEAKVEDFDVADFLAGVRAYREAVLIYRGGDLIPRMRALAARIESTPEGTNVDGLIDDFEALRREYEDGGTWWEVQARSTDWIVDLRIKAAAALGVTLTKDEARDITELAYEVREPLLYEQLARQIVVPTGVTGAALRQMADAGAEGEVRKLMTAMAFVNGKESQSSGIFRADFSQRRSGNRGRRRSSARSK
jgi:hypothetical protein